MQHITVDRPFHRRIVQVCQLAQIGRVLRRQLLGNISGQTGRKTGGKTGVKMTRITAMVSAAWPTGEQTLYGEQTNWCNIPLDSAQWFAWLEVPEHCSFSYALLNHAKGYIDGFMTVRKEHRQRGSAYWTAYRRQGCSLRKVYLGPTPALTAARLAEAAKRLYTPDGPSP